MNQDPQPQLARFPEADALKAVGILAVVFIHCMRSPWAPDVQSVEIWLLHLTAFAVPGFVAVSGFLYATPASLTGAMMRRRLQRILLPYLVASAAAQIYRFVEGMPSESGSLVGDVLLGASFGPYYYVFIIVTLVVATPLIARVPASWHPALLVFLVAGTFVSQGLIDNSRGNGLSGLYYLRNPLLFGGYFFLGWMVRVHRSTLIAALADKQRPTAALLALTSVACLAVVAAGLPPRAVMRAASVNVYVVLAFVFVLAQARRSLPGWVRFLSDGTYAIYLFHLFFMYSASSWFQHPPGGFDPAAVVGRFAVGILGSVLFVLVGRRVLGRASRLVIGA